MDYSALVSAIQTGDVHTANKLCNEATPILRRYLMVRMGASKEDAEDCVQLMFEYIIERIKNNEFHNPPALLSYMLTTCRHNYIRMINENNNEIINEINDPSVGSDQIWKLIDEEKQRVLTYCIKKMNYNYRTLADFLLIHPNAETQDIADYFNISTNNAWTRKHRVIKWLSDCIKNNL